MTDTPSAATQQYDKNDSYAVLEANGLPHYLFKDMDAAREYVEGHEKLDLDDEGTSITWPVPFLLKDPFPLSAEEYNDQLPGIPENVELQSR